MATNLFIDTECYPNYFLLMLKLPDGKKRYFELDETHKLDTETIAKFFKERLTIGFNSLMYDIPMILYALRGKNNAELKELSDRLISKEEKSFDVINKLSLWCPSYFDHIDIFKIAAGRASLKMYGARLHAPFLQDLPYDPSKAVTEEQKE